MKDDFPESCGTSQKFIQSCERSVATGELLANHCDVFLMNYKFLAFKFSTVLSDFTTREFCIY